MEATCAHVVGRLPASLAKRTCVPEARSPARRQPLQRGSTVSLFLDHLLALAATDTHRPGDGAVHRGALPVVYGAIRRTAAGAQPPLPRVGRVRLIWRPPHDAPRGPRARGRNGGDHTRGTARRLVRRAVARQR